MTEGPSGNHAGGLMAMLFAGLVLPAVSGSVDPAAAEWFREYWPTCLVVGGVGAVLFVSVVAGDNRPCPPARQFAAQTVTTFIVTGGLPVLSESFRPDLPKPGIYAAEVIAGGLFGYLLIASLDEAARAAKSDGRLGAIVGGYLRGLLFRFTGVDLTKPAAETAKAKIVTPPEVVIPAEKPGQTSAGPGNP